MNTGSATKEAAPPFMDFANREFWEGTSRGELLLRRCTACGKVHWYPRPQCPHCMGRCEWERASGRGILYSVVVDRTGKEPLAVAYVALAEGVTMLTNIVDCEVDRLAIGQEVRVTFRPGADGVMLPLFTPA